MTTPQETDPTDPPEPTGETTGMRTGSDAGAPGDPPAPEPLTGDEQDLLDGLRDDGSAPVVEPVEDADAAARAADSESVLPLDAPSGPDVDTPEFVEPR